MPHKGYFGIPNFVLQLALPEHTDMPPRLAAKVDEQDVEHTNDIICAWTLLM